MNSYKRREKYRTVMVMGDGWVEKVDETYGRKFYYNRRTRASTWTRPEINPLPPGYSDSYSLSHTQPIISHQTQQQSLMTNNNNTTSEWIKVFSSEYNRVYYYNKQTRTAVWEDPSSAITTTKQQPLLLDSRSALSPHTNTTDYHTSNNNNLSLALSILANKPTTFPTSDKFAIKTRPPRHLLPNQRDLLLHSTEKDNHHNNTTNAKNQGELLREEYKALFNHLDQYIKQERQTNKAVEPKLVISDDMDELERYAYDLKKRTEKLCKIIENHQNVQLLKQEEQHTNGSPKVISPAIAAVTTLREDARPFFIEETKSIVSEDNSSSTSTSSAEEVYDEADIPDKRLSKIKPKGDTSLTLFIDKMKAVNAGLEAVEAEREAKREAKEKYEQIRLLKEGQGDYYKLLGVEKGTSAADLKKQYFKLMIRYHPDKNRRQQAAAQSDKDGLPGLDLELDLTEKETTERANLIKDAYSVLSDPWERFIYDHFGLESYLLHIKTLQCFVNYIMSGLKIKKHGRNDKRIGLPKLSISLSYYSPKTRHLWMDFAQEHINTGPVRILEVNNEKERKAIKGVRILNITKLEKGISTQVFRATGIKKNENKYLSIITPERTLDLECETQQQRDFLCARINLLRVCKQRDESALLEHYTTFPMKKNKTKAKKDAKRVVKK